MCVSSIPRTAPTWARNNQFTRDLLSYRLIKKISNCSLTRDRNGSSRNFPIYCHTYTCLRITKLLFFIVAQSTRAARKPTSRAHRSLITSVTVVYSGQTCGASCACVLLYHAGDAGLRCRYCTPIKQEGNDTGWLTLSRPEF